MQETFPPDHERMLAQQEVNNLIDDPDAYGPDEENFLTEHFFRYTWIKEGLQQIQQLRQKGEGDRADEARVKFIAKIDSELRRLK